VTGVWFVLTMGRRPAHPATHLQIRRDHQHWHAAAALRKAAAEGQGVGARLVDDHGNGDGGGRSSCC
jgi:hypothetical protein